MTRLASGVDDLDRDRIGAIDFLSGPPLGSDTERPAVEYACSTKVIPHAFGEKAVMKLMYAALMRARQGWRNVIVTSFEIKQHPVTSRSSQQRIRAAARVAAQERIPLTNSQHKSDLTSLFSQLEPPVNFAAWARTRSYSAVELLKDKFRGGMRNAGHLALRGPRMRNRLIALGVLLLVHLDVRPDKLPSYVCLGSCTVGVAIAPVSAASAPGECLPILPIEIGVKHPDAQDVTITWLLPDGYRFQHTDNSGEKRGIDFPTVPGHLHHGGHGGDHAEKYAWSVSRGASSVSASYEVHVRRRNSGYDCAPADPVVTNLD